MLNAKSDQVLVDTYLHRRDEDSFRQLYRRHTPALYALALRLCVSENDANDAIQDTWIRACSALSAFQWKSSLRTWLTGVLINCVREQTRARKRHHEEPLADDWPVEIAELPGHCLSLEYAIARLPDGYRHVLTLHDVEGYTHEEISVLLDISVGTSKSQLHHARRAIRTLFLGEQSR
jgi:RNA polymerase sigma-70 factor, ECF subfamily